MNQKRTRPGKSKRPKGTDALLQPNSPYPGCCKPYPHARFKDQELVELHAHHVGPRCNGFREPLSVEDFNAEIDASRAVRGDER